MFTVLIGEKGLDATYQAPFPKTAKCAACGGRAEIAFVVIEDPKFPGDKKACQDEEFVCDLHPNDPDGEGYWLHDCCAVAVYFCRSCLEPTAIYNQA